jgi:uncharacterized 2Fe-2S/4Fe-4S cluster protein (DUF4445 family)
MTDLFEIDFEPIGKRVDVAVDSDLLDAARQAGIGLVSVCGGEGTCGRCRVVIMSGEVSAPVAADRRFLSQLELTSGQRLACRCHIYSDVKVHVPKASLVTDQRLQLDGKARQIGLLPRLPGAPYTQVGNAAGVGAKMALLSHKERTRAQQIARRTGYVELTVYPGFQRRFALSMLFPNNQS